MRRSQLRRPLILAALACLFAGYAAPAQEADAPEVAAIVRIDGAIDDVAERTLELRVRRAVADAPRFLILSIDSKGGSHIPARTIAHNLHQLGEETPITTVAFIRGDALRDATVLAFGCERIAMRLGSRMGSPDPGDATPRTETMRLDLEAMAKARTYPVDVAAAMVDPSVELHRVTWRTPTDRMQIAWLSKAALAEQPAAWRAKLLSDDVVCPEGRRLVVDDVLASEMGLASMFAADEEDLCRQLAREFSIGEVVPKRVDALWWTSIVRWITWWPVKVFLFAIGAIALIIAMGQPGTGLPEAVFITCFVLVFFGSYLIGLTDWVELILLAIGIGLLAVEVFVTPGFGVMGGLGALCLFGALLLSFQKFVLPSDALEWGLLAENAGKTVIGFGIGVVAFGLTVRLLPKTKIVPGLMHEHTLESTPLETEAHHDAPVGTTCTATTALRPVGKVKVGKRHFDAVAEDGMIDAGATLVVVGHRGHELIVSSRPEAKQLTPEKPEPSKGSEETPT